jgi:hypothetical protein
MPREQRLDELTSRWQARRGLERARRAASGEPREAADPERLERARSAFPYRDTTPAAYVAEHGSGMIAYTYDDYAYPDDELQAWLDEVGRLLRQQPATKDR